ncbi:MAG TPA: glycyl-radical enzyme activating protein [Gammaproteobacteria bacterium]|nr:glycyl-radical enzyme activating protein [Gammaproteobacteria bacterium]
MADKALIFDIKRDCSEDGPGIRTTVFFKGCPLACRWCQNPESKTKTMQLSFNRELCEPSVCGVACVKVCEPHCLSFVDRLHVNYEQCTRCDRCFDVCPTKALEPVGYWLSLEELMYRISIDIPFFQSSGGGVTLSGGEATQQMSFVHRLLVALKEKGIHTALETSGFFNYRRFKERLLPHLDLVYYDIKLIDDAESRKYTGQSNRLILENFKKLIKDASVPVVPRIPLIPGVTTSKKNLTGIAKFLQALSIDKATLLPYNPLWHDKLERIHLASSYELSTFMSQEEKSRCVEYFYSES